MLLCRRTDLLKLYAWILTNKQEVEYFPVHVSSGVSVTYHQFLHKSFPLRHHILQLGDHLQILMTALPVPELILCSFQPVRSEITNTNTQYSSEQQRHFESCKRKTTLKTLNLELTLNIQEIKRWLNRWLSFFISFCSINSTCSLPCCPPPLLITKTNKQLRVWNENRAALLLRCSCVCFVSDENFQKRLWWRFVIFLSGPQRKHHLCRTSNSFKIAWHFLCCNTRWAKRVLAIQNIIQAGNNQSSVTRSLGNA